MAELTRLSTGNGLPNVVVTGFAMTTALATDAEGTWKRLLDGESGIRTLDDYFVELYDLPVRIGGHLLEDFESELTPSRTAVGSPTCRRWRPSSAGGPGRTQARPRSTPGA